MVIVKNVNVHKELPSSTGCDALPKQSNTLADKTGFLIRVHFYLILASRWNSTQARFLTLSLCEPSTVSMTKSLTIGRL